MIDSDTDETISGYSYLTGNDISIEGIDPVLHPSIQLVAYFTTNGLAAPILHGWSADWYRTFYSGMAVGNNIHHNDIGIQCNDSSPLIIDNIISNNDDKGINISISTLDTMETTHMEDTTYREFYLDYTDTYERNYITVPNWATVTDAEIIIQGGRYIPECNVSQYFVYEGWVNDTKEEQELNTNLSIDKPTTWENVYSYIYYDNLSESGVPVNATVVDLSAWCNNTNLTFTNQSSSLYFNSSVVLDSEDPMVVSITTDNSSVKGNFTGRTFVTNTTNLTWNNTDYGFSTSVSLFPPDANVTESTLKLYIPHGGFAELEAYVVETDQDISSNFSISNRESGYVTLDLWGLTDIGDVWNSSDSQRSIRVNLTFYTKSPSIDVGGDGDDEWEWSGEFNTTQKVSSEELIDEFNSIIEENFFETTTIPVDIGVESASHINISGIRVEWEYRPTIVYNEIHNSEKGIFTNETTMLRIMDNEIYDNTYGIIINSTLRNITSISSLATGEENLTITMTGNTDNTAYLRLPKGIYITNASFNLTGSRYVPGVAGIEQGYEYMGICVNYSMNELNDTIWSTRPTNWDVSSLGVTAETLTRQPGDGLAVWSVNNNQIDFSRWNKTEWVNGTAFNEDDVRWVESAYKPGYVEQTVLMLNSSGTLTGRMWNGSGWPSSIETLTSTASNASALCFDVVYQASSLTPLAIFSNNSTSIKFKVFDGERWSEEASYSVMNASWIKAVSVPDSDNVVILVMNENDQNLTALYWDGSGIQYNWTLTTYLSNNSSPCFDLGIEYYTNNVVAAWGNGSNKMTITRYDGIVWSNVSTENISDVNRIEASWSRTGNDISFLAGAENGNLTAIIWNGNTVENTTILTDSLSSTTNGSFDVIIDSDTTDTVAVWANNSNALEWSYYNGASWSNKDNKSTSEIRWVRGASDYDQLEGIFLTMDINNDINAYRWNGSDFNSSILTLESTASDYNYRCFEILYENPTIPVIPSHLNLTANYNGTWKNFTDDRNEVSFYAFDLDYKEAYSIWINRTLNEDVSGYFSSDMRVYNNTEKNWNRVHNGYYMTVPLWAPSVNVSTPQLKLYLPNGYYADIYVNITGTTRSIGTDFIHEEAKQYNFITIDLTNVTEIGNIWNANDTNVTLNITLVYYCKNPSLDVGNDGDSEWFYQGDFNISESVKESDNRLVKELNTLVANVGVGYVDIPLALSCPVAGNITMSHIILEYEYHPQIYDNEISDNSGGIDLKANTTISENLIVSNLNGIAFPSSDDYGPIGYVSGYVTGNLLMDNTYRGIYVKGTAHPYIYNNNFTKQFTGNMNGIEATSTSFSVIEGNNFTSNEIGISLLGSGDKTTFKNTTILSNLFEENDVGFFCINAKGIIEGNEIREHEEEGIHSYDSDLTIRTNEITNNENGAYFEENIHSTINFTSNTVIGNEKGVYCAEYSRVNISGCSFTANDKSIFTYLAENITVEECSFSYNDIGANIWESEFSINNCSFTGNKRDYHTTAGANFTVEDCDYTYGKGEVAWSYEEELIPHYRDWTTDIEDMKIGDVNNDTYNDIVVLNMSHIWGGYYYHNITIFLYNSTEEDFDDPIVIWLYDGDSYWRSMAVENIDDDYECEILVAYDNITILDWNGATWTKPAYSPIIGNDPYHDIVCGDVNNDTHPDIVALSRINIIVSVFLWNSTANDFDYSDDLNTLPDPTAVFIDDTNDDGNEDIIVNYMIGNISIFNQSAVGFNPGYDLDFSKYSQYYHSEQLIIDDINGDDKNDIVVGMRFLPPNEGYNFVYRLWNTSSSSYDDETYFNTGATYCVDCTNLKYFDCDNDGEKEIVASLIGDEEYIDVFSISNMTLTMTNRISDTLSSPLNLEFGLLNNDTYIDAICYSPIGGSILLWNGSTSNTTRSLVIDVRNDTNVGVNNASVKILNSASEEIFDLATNATGITPTVNIRLLEKDITDEEYFGPFRVNITKFAGGTWYNVTRYFNMTTDEGVYSLIKYIGNDTDDDGLTDGEEVYVIRSNASDSDTDNDNILDGTEYGINDTTKSSTTGVGFVADLDSKNRTDPMNNDTDGDGLLDNLEDKNYNGKWDAGETYPANLDSDGDTLPDGWIDYDNDNVKDLGEYEDYDLDGVVDGGVWGAGGETDPFDNDTDADNSCDRLEVCAAYDPLDNTNTAPTTDTDGDMLEDVLEIIYGTDLNDVDSDDDGFWDGYYDANDNGVFDLILELGEDVNLNGNHDLVEMDAESSDTDGDGLSDLIENPKDSNGNRLTWWWEAEDGVTPCR